MKIIIIEILGKFLIGARNFENFFFLKIKNMWIIYEAYICKKKNFFNFSYAKFNFFFFFLKNFQKFFSGNEKKFFVFFYGFNAK